MRLNLLQTANPQNTEKSGNKAFVDLKYFSVPRKNLHQYVRIYKHTYLWWFVGKAIRAAREAMTISKRSYIFSAHLGFSTNNTMLWLSVVTQTIVNTSTLWHNIQKHKLRPLVVRSGGSTVLMSVHRDR